MRMSYREDSGLYSGKLRDFSDEFLISKTALVDSRYVYTDISLEAQMFYPLAK